MATKTIARIPDMSDHCLDVEAIPDHTVEDFCRVIFGEVRRFFADPAVKADYEKWREEYHKIHPQKGDAN